MASELKREIATKKYSAASDCPITATIHVIGGKWKPVIIWLLIDNTKRFGELHKSIPGITLKVLTRQLKELESNAIVNRKVYRAVPPKVEYSLTEKGKSLIPLMETMASWSRTNIKS
ncbi:transcriptional regulator [Cytophagales bacterium WSM2-2]|nr:transcriptional regulator [Cytophagales bacterium WSM2-2]